MYSKEDRRRFHRLEPVEFVHGPDLFHHLARRPDRGGIAILEPARQARLQFLGFFGFFGHARHLPADA
ncbi:hypothetical protein ACVWZK_002481 [Bradyrhizobium sp. GM0.4]